MTDRLDEEIGKAVCEAAGEPRAEVRARAVEGMRAARPARVRSRRWLGVAVAAGMVMVGLGIVSVPFGKGNQEWNRVLAAVNSASSVHVKARWIGSEGEIVSESWSADGFHRSEHRQEGELVRVQLYSDIPTRRSLGYDVRNGEKHGIDRALRPKPRTNWAAMGTFGGGGDDLRSSLTRLAEDGNVRTRRVATAGEGGGVDVIEAEMTQEREWSGPAHMGDRLRVRAEIDPLTDRVLSIARYKLEGEEWKQIYATESIEYDVPIPDYLKSFTFPKGTTVAYSRWWEGRTDEIIAEEKSDGWTVRAHALDVDTSGDVYVTFSLWSDWDRDMAGWPLAEAIDNREARYGRFPSNTGTVYDDYGVVVLRPEVELSPKGWRPPTEITITFWPREDEEPVVLRRLPLPPSSEVVYQREIVY